MRSPLIATVLLLAAFSPIAEAARDVVFEVTMRFDSPDPISIERRLEIPGYTEIDMEATCPDSVTHLLLIPQDLPGNFLTEPTFTTYVCLTENRPLGSGGVSAVELSAGNYTVRVDGWGWGAAAITMTGVRAD